MEFIEHQQELTELVEKILSEAKRFRSSRSVGEHGAGFGVSVRKGELENLEFNQDRGFGITLYFGKRKGSASTTDSSEAAIRETVAAAKGIAKHTEEDPYSGLADASLMPATPIALDLYHPWDIEPEQAAAMAIECETAGLAVDGKLTNSDGAQINSQRLCGYTATAMAFLGLPQHASQHELRCDWRRQ